MNVQNWLLAVCVALTGTLAWSQETTGQTEEAVETARSFAIQTVQEGEGGSNVTQMSVMAIDSGDGPAVIMASPALGGPGMNVGFGFNTGPMDSFALLNNPSVQKDLELVDEQIEMIQELNREFSEQMSEQFKNGIRPGNGDEIRKIMEEMQRKKKDRISEILLEHQQDRLKQVALQSQLNMSGTANALGSQNFRELLDLSDEQIERLRKRSAELQKKMQEKIEQMKEEMKEELLGELTPQQQSKLKELLGNRFENRSEDWQALRQEQRRRLRERRETRDRDDD